MSATVVMAPQERLLGRRDLYRKAITDDLGHYRLDPAMPGDYKLFAWAEVDEGGWTDPEFLKDYEKRGEAVTIGARERKSVALQTPESK